MRLRTFCSVALLYAFQMSAQSLESHFAAGQSALKEGRLEAAVAEFRKVLQISPGLAEAEVNLGLAQYLLGNYSESTAVMAKVSRARPGLTPAVLFLGLGYLKLGSAKQAVGPLEKVVKADPNNVEARQALAAASLALGNYPGAVQQFRTLFDLEADKGEAWFRLGRSYTDCASRLVRFMSRQYRKTAWGHRMAGDLYSETGRDELAAQEYREAQAAGAEGGNASNDSARQISVGKKLFVAKQYEEAADQLAASPEFQKSEPEAVYYLARCYQLLAAECFRQQEEVAPNTWQTHAIRAESYHLRNDDPQAIREYEEAARLRPDAAEIYEQLAELFIQGNRQEKARAALEKALALEPARARALYLLGQSYVNGHDEAKAIPYLQRALRYDANLTEAHAYLGRAFLHEGKPAQAVAEVEKALPLDIHGDLHYLLSRAYGDLGKTELARAALKKSAEMRKGSLDRDRDKLDRWMKN
jgi:tetratricopeptide (TPR) repeat protein